MASANASALDSCDEHARFAGEDGFDRTAASKGDDRTSARLGLERHDAEVLFARQQHDGCASIEIANLIVRQPSEEGGAVSGAPLESASLRSIADDFERDVRACAGVNRHVDALVGHERRDDQRKGLRRIGARVVEVGVDGRIHD